MAFADETNPKGKDVCEACHCYWDTSVLNRCHNDMIIFSQIKMTVKFFVIICSLSLTWYHDQSDFFYLRTWSANPIFSLIEIESPSFRWDRFVQHWKKSDTNMFQCFSRWPERWQTCHRCRCQDRGKAALNASVCMGIQAESWFQRFYVISVILSSCNRSRVFKYIEIILHLIPMAMRRPIPMPAIPASER